jgi:hypothetical protein
MGESPGHREKRNPLRAAALRRTYFNLVPHVVLYRSDMDQRYGVSGWWEWTDR